MLSILIIDDEVEILNAVKLLLKKSGYKVETAINGAEGIRKFDEGVYDLVITDIRMPGKSGHEVLKYIKQSKRKNTPVIGTSGTPWMLNHSDFQSVLPKPFSSHALKKIIRNIYCMKAA